MSQHSEISVPKLEVHLYPKIDKFSDRILHSKQRNIENENILKT